MHTNKTLQRLAHLDAQLAQLKAIEEKGSYIAEGLRIHVQVGPHHDDSKRVEVDLSIVHGPEVQRDLLKQMREYLIATRRYWIGQLREEFRAMQLYFHDLEGGAQ